MIYYDYNLLGTVSILAAVDLHTGLVTAQAHDPTGYASSYPEGHEFISLLQEFDEHYPPE